MSQTSFYSEIEPSSFVSMPPSPTPHLPPIKPTASPSTFKPISGTTVHFSGNNINKNHLPSNTSIKTSGNGKPVHGMDNDIHDILQSPSSTINGSSKRAPKKNKIGVHHQNQNNTNGTQSRPSARNAVSPIPAENTVIISAEIHREKTPSLISDASGIDNLAFESPEHSRRRAQDSVV